MTVLWPFAMIPALVPLASLLFVWSTDRLANELRMDWSESFEYDYIIVGGGSAGAVLANRLSEDKDKMVLLLEAGGSDNPMYDIPAAAPYLQMTPVDWQYLTEPQENACLGMNNRQSRWARGKVLGGSSVLNYMLYVRGNKRDYNRWAAEGADGWSWPEVFPYFLKSEDNRDNHTMKNGHHRSGGYLTVSTPSDATPLGRAFPDAGKHLGYPAVDINGPVHAGFGLAQGTERDGARCSTAKAFLEPVMHRPNLQVVTFALVTEIIFDQNKRAIGVKFDRGLRKANRVHARREVILSAGAINSPQLLMLSGIGPRKHLESLEIPVLADLPVGENLQDHIFAPLPFVADRETLPRLVLTPKSLYKYYVKGAGPLNKLGNVEGLAFVKTKFTNASDDWPDIELHMHSGSMAYDRGLTARVYGVTKEVYNSCYKPHENDASFSLLTTLLRPQSRGYVRLRTADPFDAPIMDPKYFSHPDDIRTMVDALKISISIGLGPVYRKLGSKLFEYKLPGCQNHTLWSDEYLACFARTLTATIYHPVGTCRMGRPDDPRTVVDQQLRVKGVSGLRVVDASVMPNIVSGNTNAPVIMIAEKISDVIRGRRLLTPYEPK